jgi:hypothetical protein
MKARLLTGLMDFMMNVKGDTRWVYGKIFVNALTICPCLQL